VIGLAVAAESSPFQQITQTAPSSIRQPEETVKKMSVKKVSGTVFLSR
jgi:hypothetical protein